ncbi:type I phosphomannose isomerase catalytic subunit [Polaribacter sp. IC073]|uniref:type I phosphomannose isomerase catalytic subunit n=1 Tax=Polaribacter sp. IC073 TaxID=2508540 RepID=UPI0011BFC354|nr:type I phosphomannose isomerase catalytic subunit [Polaribacter sp. IC073]TXD48001.1 mannose-6-phosphate isomerase [Polaribacter sp. IC073]
MKLHPLKFTPLFKYRLWGGDKLKSVLHKEYSESNIGESWEISDVENDETIVANGFFEGKTLRDLTEEYKGKFLGEAVYKQFGNEFPLLIKFIDAKTPLSIQVHPGNEIAKERHNSFGKNEMWYVMEADKDAELIVGFDKEIDKTGYDAYVADGSILEVMHHENVAEGDTFYIPTGRVHAIGSGVLLAEIQQTSDITYRIYDYNRVDAKTGELRDLHNDLAKDVIDFECHETYKTTYEAKTNVSNELVHSPYFTSNFLIVEGTIQKDYSNLDSFVIYICVAGDLELTHNKKSFSLKKGETILLPASIDTIELKSLSEKSKLLEVYL